VPGAIDVRKRLIAASQFGAGATPYAPATWYAGILLVRGNADGSGFSEPTIGVGAYARVAITNNVTNWPAPTTVGGVTVTTNGTKITWPNPTGLWGKMVAIGLFDVSTGGLPQYSQPAKTELTIQSGNSPVELDIGFLKIPW
jgi:hypothetical protein